MSELTPAEQHAFVMAELRAHRRPDHSIDGNGYSPTDKGLMTTAEAAAYLGFQPRTLKKWRYVPRGPVYLKIGQAVRYRKAEIDAWLESTRGTTSEERAAEQ